MRIKRKKIVLKRKKKPVSFMSESKKNSDPTETRAKKANLSHASKEEQFAMRQIAYQFMYYKSLGDLATLQKLGYTEATDKCFIAKHGVCGNYMYELIFRKNYKQEWFDYVTTVMSQELPIFLATIVSKGNEKTKGAQILMPEQIGPSLATRKMQMEGGADDEKFMDTFFGFSNKGGE